jgi:hypothetical protein
MAFDQLASIALAVARSQSDLGDSLAQMTGLEWLTGLGALIGAVGVAWLRVRDR